MLELVKWYFLVGLHHTHVGVPDVIALGAQFEDLRKCFAVGEHQSRRECTASLCITLRLLLSVRPRASGWSDTMILTA